MEVLGAVLIIMWFLSPLENIGKELKRFNDREEGIEEQNEQDN